MAHKRAGKKSDANFGKRRVAVLPLAAVERVHVFPAACNRADGESAADDFAVSGKVGTNIEIGLRTAGMQAEAGYDFIEDERGAGLFGDAAQLLQKFARLKIQAAALHRLDQDRGDFRATGTNNVERFGIP